MIVAGGCTQATYEKCTEALTFDKTKAPYFPDAPTCSDKDVTWPEGYDFTDAQLVIATIRANPAIAIFIDCVCKSVCAEFQDFKDSNPIKSGACAEAAKKVASSNSQGINCEGSWSQCGADCHQTYMITTTASGGGAECPTEAGSQRKCNGEQCVHCAGDWGSCRADCKKTYAIATPASTGGQQCPAANGQIESCAGGKCQTQGKNCVGLWSQCGGDCRKTYTITTPASGSGAQCLATNGEVKECTTGQCVNCVGSWGTCGANCQKIYSVTTPASTGGTTCLSNDGKTAGCAGGQCQSQGVNCVGAWGECGANCKKIYTITTPKEGVGSECSASNQATVDCDGGQCIHCQGTWGTCEASCQKTYAIETQPSVGGQKCPTTLTETCEGGQCQNCVGKWGPCASNCKQTYQITTPKSSGGKTCPKSLGDITPCIGGGCQCASGKFVNTKSKTCENCRSGTFSEQPNTATCQDCPSGWTTVGLFGSLECTKNIGVCADGEGRNDAGKCKTCHAGEYSDDGTEGQETCQLCAEDTFTQYERSAVCAVCPKGKTTDSKRGQTMCNRAPASPKPPSDDTPSAEYVVHHIILLQGISAGTFNEDPSMIKSFRQAIATLLKVLESDILNIVASEKEDTPRRRQLSRRRLESPSCSVSYDIRTGTEEEMETVSTQMTTAFADSDTFTTELQASMVANNIDSVSPGAISSDTTASPEKTTTVVEVVSGSGAKDASSAAVTRDEDDVDVVGGVLWKLGLGLAGIVLVVAVIALVVRNNKCHKKKMTAYSPTDEPAVPTIEMFETRGSKNYGNPLNEKWENEEASASVQIKAAQPSRLMSEPQHHTRTSTQLPPNWNKYNTDDGHRYYTNNQTQESQWLAPEGATGGTTDGSTGSSTGETVAGHANNPMNDEKQQQHHARNLTQLPPDWNKHTDAQGRRYYSKKTTTHTTQWTAPEGATGGSTSK